MKPIQKSELVLNEDNSVYHLNLHPNEIAETIILVGDPSRANKISKHFDKIEFSKYNREFITHTGTIGSKRITALSTGIGTDNIDIVLNELDALVNINLKNRMIKDRKKELTLIRIGTSGSLHEDIPVDSFLLSKYGLGLDGLMHYYKLDDSRFNIMREAFLSQTNWNIKLPEPYLTEPNKKLYNTLNSSEVYTGITATATGFYAPQGRKLRLPILDENLQKNLGLFKFQKNRITNFEMETSALFGLSELMGHNACTICAVIANRISKSYSKNHNVVIEKLISYVFNKIL